MRWADTRVRDVATTSDLRHCGPHAVFLFKATTLYSLAEHARPWPSFSLVLSLPLVLDSHSPSSFYLFMYLCFFTFLHLILSLYFIYSPSSTLSLSVSPSFAFLRIDKIPSRLTLTLQKTIKYD